MPRAAARAAHSPAPNEHPIPLLSWEFAKREKFPLRSGETGLLSLPLQQVDETCFHFARPQPQFVQGTAVYWLTIWFSIYGDAFPIPG